VLRKRQRKERNLEGNYDRTYKLMESEKNMGEKKEGERYENYKGNEER
jgi:hypothetical protein